jgi:hypothetical protein
LEFAGAIRMPVYPDLLMPEKPVSGIVLTDAPVRSARSKDVMQSPLEVASQSPSTGGSPPKS